MPEARKSKTTKKANANAKVQSDVNDTPDEVNEEDEDVKTVDVNFYNIHEGAGGRLPGKYLDDVERQEAEDERAYWEDREPDYETMGGTAGTPLVPSNLLAPIGVRSGEVHPAVDTVAVEPVNVLPVVDTGDVAETQTAIDGSMTPTRVNPDEDEDEKDEE